jgi:hypothetical protein
MSNGNNQNLEYLRKAAKRLLRSLKKTDAEALAEVSQHHPKYTGKTPAELVAKDFSLHDAQLIVARQKGFASWPAMLAFIGHDRPDNAISLGLTDDQLQLFEEDGYIRLPGAIGREEAVEMERFIWNCLAKLHGIVEEDRSTWSKSGPWVGLNEFKREAVFAPIYQGLFRDVCDQLLGPKNWRKPTSSGGFLVTFPSCDFDQWEIPSKAWHVDAHFTYAPEQLFGIRTFAYVSDVLPRSGGTLVVRGSHRLLKRFVMNMAEDELRKGFSVLCDEFTASHPWFNELCNESRSGDPKPSKSDRISRFWERPCLINGVQLEVEELCGTQGDIIIAHPWLLHTRAPHAGERPRFVLSKDVFRLEHSS